MTTDDQRDRLVRWEAGNREATTKAGTLLGNAVAGMEHEVLDAACPLCNVWEAIADIEEEAAGVRDTAHPDVLRAVMDRAVAAFYSEHITRVYHSEKGRAKALANRDGAESWRAPVEAAVRAALEAPAEPPPLSVSRLAEAIHTLGVTGRWNHEFAAAAIAREYARLAAEPATPATVVPDPQC